MPKGPRSSKKDPITRKGFELIVLGLGLAVASLFIGGHPILRPVAQGLRTGSYYVLIFGAALLLIGYAVSRARAQPPRDRAERMSRRDPPMDFFPAQVDPPVPPREPVASVEKTQFASAHAARWSRDVFAQIEWRRFEALCEALFSQAGFEAKSQSHGADGGVDIWLYSKNAEGPAAVVQCKHWMSKPVGVKELREFYGVMASKGLKRGTYATSSTFTPAATEFARDNGINALGADELLALIGRRTEEQREALLKVAFEGDYATPTCASCGVKMTQRISKKDGKRFWGCTNFPRCGTTMAYREG